MKRSGSVLMEFLFGFPVILILMMAIFQFAQLEIARMVVHYAAYCGARAALVHHQNEAATAVQRAAEYVCAWITLDDYPEDEGGEEPKPIAIPGWGDIPNSEATVRKTTTTYSYSESDMSVRVEVRHRLSLVAPVIGQMIAENMQWSDPETEEMFTTDGSDASRTSLFPSLEIPAVCVMSKPYKTIHQTGLP